MAKYLSIILILLLVGCGVRVHTDRGWMGPNVYYATDGKIEVRYYNGQCCCIAKKVLESLADRANSGKLDWNRMADEKFQDYELALQCKIEQANQYGYNYVIENYPDFRWNGKEIYEAYPRH